MWSDRETRDDCLGFWNYVAVLAQVCTEKEIAPFTLGIFGSWGCGKTSLMTMLKEHIDQEKEKWKVKTIWFNAWRYEGKEEAQSALIHLILNKLAEDKTLAQNAQDVLNRLKDGASILKLAKVIGQTAITLTPDISGLVNSFKEESQKIAETMEQFQKDFEELLQRMQVERIVIFIDDLDRCQSNKVIETFETIKLFLNIPECTFVIGADSEKIEQAIGDTYRVIDQDRKSFSRDYLEKIIQLPFRIPEQGLEDIAWYVGSLVLRPYLKESSWKALLNERHSLVTKDSDATSAFMQWAVTHASDCKNGKPELVIAQIKKTLPYVNILARGLRGNPRQIKRFLNILTLRQRLADQNHLSVDADLLIKLAVLEYAWPDFFMQIVETFDPTTGSSTLISEIVTAQKDPGKAFDSAWAKSAIESPGLVDFLLDKPAIDHKVNLEPYLFLAQTSLTAQRVTLSPLDETAKSLALRLSSEDRVRAEATARQISRMDSKVINAVVRLVVPRLVTEEDDRVATHILTGLDLICRSHPANYPEVLPALGQVHPKPKSAIALAGNTFLENAVKGGIEVPADLKDKFSQASPFGQAFNKKGGGRLRPEGK